jgi:hypothetical protein
MAISRQMKNVLVGGAWSSVVAIPAGVAFGLGIYWPVVALGVVWVCTLGWLVATRSVR